jgi:hypothetical protein
LSFCIVGFRYFVSLWCTFATDSQPRLVSVIVV